MGGWRLLPSGSLKSALRGPHRGAGPLRCLAAAASRLLALSVTAAAVPASRLPPRVMQPSGLRPSPTDAAAETGRWATSHRDVAAPKGEPSLASPLGGGGLALARTERASCQPHRPLPWLSPLRARAPRSLILFWLTPIKVKAVRLRLTNRKLFEKSLSKNFHLASLGLP